MSNLNLSKEEAIRNHRDMWNWIANETLKRKRTIFKEDYFVAINIDYDDIPENYCYCCEYAYSYNPCYNTCPIHWSGDKSCINASSEYFLWVQEENYIKSAELARQIANLPEREI